MDAANEPMFWPIVHVSKRAHDPLQHHMGFLSKLIPADVIEARGNHVTQLASGKGREIMNECVGVLYDIQWVRMLLDETLVHTKWQQSKSALVVELNCHHAAS